MKISKQESIQPNTPGILLLSHGPLAQALIQSAELISGPCKNIESFCLDEGDDIEAYRAEVSGSLEYMPEGSIVLLDLFGGTPCNQLVYIAKLIGRNIPAVSGMNLPMLLEAVFQRESVSGHELVSALARSSIEGVKVLELEKVIG